MLCIKCCFCIIQGVDSTPEGGDSHWDQTGAEAQRPSQLAASLQNAGYQVASSFWNNGWYQPGRGTHKPAHTGSNLYTIGIANWTENYILLLLFQGSSQTEESSSQRTSSTVLAKEALIEIDYSNLSEDLKVASPHSTSALHLNSPTWPPPHHCILNVMADWCKISFLGQ